VGQQQVKGEKRARQKEVIHGVQVDSAQRGQDEDQKEKEKQRHWRKVRNAACERPRLQLLRHLKRKFESRDQVLLVQFDLPALAGVRLLRGRQRMLGKIKPGEIRRSQ